MISLQSTTGQATLSEQVAILENAQAQAQSHAERYRAIWEQVLNHGQLDTINANNFTEDVAFNTRQGMINGIENVKNYYRNILRGTSNLQFTVFDTIVQGDKLANYWRFQGTTTATGDTVDYIGVTLVSLRDGKIATEQDFVEDTFFQSE